MKKIFSLLPSLVSICLFFIFSFAHCPKDQIEPVDSKTLAEQISGNYSGYGKYMPGNVKLGSNTNTCIVPDLIPYLKSGGANAKINSLTETKVAITLSGGIYNNPFTYSFELSKIGDVISDNRGIVNYFSSTKSLEIDFTLIQVVNGGGCNGVNNKYYYSLELPLTSPPSPKWSYYSYENWEFIGNK